MQFTHTYSELGERFFQRIRPLPVSAPSLLLFNNVLAKQLNIPLSIQQSLEQQSLVFSGNTLTETAMPIALAYCGHQFGQLNPQLGDGRAHLLGELIDNKGKRVDVQLKGSGPTQYSRRGDGRSALGPALREYIMSEAMFYLGVPTTRTLAVVATGEQVYRETIKPGGISTRVASSHIRVGTFVYYAVNNDLDGVNALLDYSIQRHFPELEQAENKAAAFLQSTMQKQITLIVEWMRVGFIHGVMNTDNCAISGETIDYGPCAMMGAYNPGAVFSSIDVQGRYAFGNQPSIALWNMTRLAESLLPLIATEEQESIKIAEAILGSFANDYENAFEAMMLNKLGLGKKEGVAVEFIQTFLELLKENTLDYTIIFNTLLASLDDTDKAVELLGVLGPWYRQWRQLVGEHSDDIAVAKILMRKANPVVIPRNHHVEAVLTACEQSLSGEPAAAFLAVLREPYTQLPDTLKYQDAPKDADSHYKTFCGT